MCDVGGCLPDAGLFDAGSALLGLSMLFHSRLTVMLGAVFDSRGVGRITPRPVAATQPAQASHHAEVQTEEWNTQPIRWACASQ
jgi:hypothetical protein